MRILLVAATLLTLGFVFGGNVVPAAEAAAKKCDYAQCIQRCNQNRGRPGYCTQICLKCQ